MKRTAYLILLLVSIIFASSAAAKNNIKHSVSMHRNDLASPSTTSFSPYDNILIQLNLYELPKGDYAYSVNWYNPFGELEDTSSYYFSLPRKASHSCWSKLDFEEAGTLTRLFSVSETTGFNVKYYGRWQVKLFINGDKIYQQEFDIN